MMIRKKSLILCVLNPTYMFKRNNILIHILVSRECINMFFFIASYLFFKFVSMIANADIAFTFSRMDIDILSESRRL